MTNGHSFQPAGLESPSGQDLCLEIHPQGYVEMPGMAITLAVPNMNSDAWYSANGLSAG